MMQVAQSVAPGVARTELGYAGFWRRALAAVIDGTFLTGIALAIASSVHALVPNDFVAIANIVPVSAAVTWAYFVLLESSPAQGTIGKIALNLRVCDVHADPITFRRATFRNALKVLSTAL